MKRKKVKKLKKELRRAWDVADLWIEHCKLAMTTIEDLAKMSDSYQRSTLMTFKNFRNVSKQLRDQTHGKVEDLK